MLNIIIRYSNVTTDILLFGNTDLPVHINEEICTCLYSQNEKVHVISPIIILLVALQSLSLSLSLSLSRQHLSRYLSIFVELLFYYLCITGSKKYLLFYCRR